MPVDTTNMVTKVGPNDAGYNDKMKDRSIALDAAEVSAEKRLAHVRAQKAAWMKQQKDEGKASNSMTTGQEPTPPTPVINVEEMGTTPGRKARKPDVSPEDLEYEDRSTLKSWSEAAGTPPEGTP